MCVCVCEMIQTLHRIIPGLMLMVVVNYISKMHHDNVSSFDCGEQK